MDRDTNNEALEQFILLATRELERQGRELSEGLKEIHRLRVDFEVAKGKIFVIAAVAGSIPAVLASIPTVKALLQ